MRCSRRQQQEQAAGGGRQAVGGRRHVSRRRCFKVETVVIVVVVVVVDVSSAIRPETWDCDTRLVLSMCCHSMMVGISALSFRCRSIREDKVETLG